MFYRKRSAIQAELDSLHVQPPLARSAKIPRSRDRLTRLLYGRPTDCDDDVECDVKLFPLTRLWLTSEQCSLAREAPEVSAIVESRPKTLAKRGRSAKRGMHYANEICKSGMQSGIDYDKTIPTSFFPSDAKVNESRSAESETNVKINSDSNHSVDSSDTNTNQLDSVKTYKSDCYERCVGDRRDVSTTFDDDLSVNPDSSSNCSSSDSDSDTSTSCDDASDYTNISENASNDSCSGDMSNTIDDDTHMSRDSTTDDDDSSSSDNSSSSNTSSSHNNSDSSTSSDNNSNSSSTSSRGSPDSTTSSGVNSNTKGATTPDKANVAHKQRVHYSTAIHQKPYWIRRKFKVEKPLYREILRKNLRRCGVEYWWPRDAQIRILIRDGYIQPDDDYNDDIQDGWSDDSYSDSEDEMNAQLTYEELASSNPAMFFKHENDPTDQFHYSDGSMNHDDSSYNSSNDDDLTDLDIRVKNILENISALCQLETGSFFKELRNCSGESQAEHSKDPDMQDDCVSNNNGNHNDDSFLDHDIPMLDIPDYDYTEDMDYDAD